jgi:hypothetical protein
MCRERRDGNEAYLPGIDERRRCGSNLPTVFGRYGSEPAAAARANLPQNAEGAMTTGLGSWFDRRLFEK